MELNLKDLLHTWDWLQQRRLRSVRKFGAKQPSPDTSSPCPHLELVAFYPVGNVGTPLPILISVRNLGAQAAAGGISISFPEISRNGEGAYVEVADSSGGEFILREAGDELMSSDRGHPETFTARYLVREVHFSPWKTDERVEFRLTLTPSRAGTFTFLVTSWAANGDWSRIARTPVVRDMVDQQNHAAFPYVFSALAHG